ncbi:hypothetical protein [Actinocorallia sp. A-T 12471]|nr:hypothetical protein [Actinocorallia sp. A-T 12471]MDX6743263.1 hypothetical protein [Actinocorallia sp. A-T 12471]
MQLDEIATRALAGIGGDSVEGATVVAKNLTAFVAEGNSSMMGGWT